MTDDAEYRKLVDDIGDAIRGVQDICRQHGIFDGHRELLECWNCGLMEDVAFDDRLMSYRAGAEDVDTGLQFLQPDEDGVSRCPGCGAVVISEEGDDDLSCP